MMSAPKPQTQDVSESVQHCFPKQVRELLEALKPILQQHNVEAYLIGGVVRDMLLSKNLTPHPNPLPKGEGADLDITVVGDAIAVATNIAETLTDFKLIETYPPFGTAKLKYKNSLEVDLASTRLEAYESCGVLPEVVKLGVPLAEELGRRDFTVNALALSVTDLKTVVDYLDGLSDLGTKKIRILKPDSFFEDPSRILRAVRFAARLDFDFAEETSASLSQFLSDWITEYKGGGERIKTELMRFLALPESPAKIKWLKFFQAQGLHRLFDTRLEPAFKLPEDWQTISSRIQTLSQNMAAFWQDNLVSEIYLTLIFTALKDAQAKSAMNKLGLTRHEIHAVEVVKEWMIRKLLVSFTKPTDKPAALYNLFHNVPLAAVFAAMAVLPASTFEDSAAAFLKYKQELEPIKLEVTGADVMALGVPAGEQVGQLLEELLEVKLEGQIRHKIEEIDWLKSRLTP